MGNKQLLALEYSFEDPPLINTFKGDFKVYFIEIYSDRSVKCIGIYLDTKKEGIIIVKSKLGYSEMIDNPELIFKNEYT